jgi:hypothetical protein
MTRAVGSLLAALAACAASAAQAELGAPVFQWQRCAPAYCETGWYASPAVADLDRDGLVEVLGGGYRLLAARGDTGALLWTYPPSGSAVAPGRMWPGPAVADVDGDGDREIVVVQYEKLAVLDAAGALRPGWPQSPYGSAEMRTLAVADLDGNGANEILVARASGGGDETWSVLQPNGTTRPGWPRLAALDPGYAWGAYNQNLAVGDLDGDGDLEIAASSDVHYLAAFADDGTPLAANSIYGAGENWSQVGVHYDHAVDLRGYANCDSGPPLEPRPNFADAPPAIGDLDGDGRSEIVVVGSFYDCRVGGYPQLFQVPMIFEIDRTRWAASGFDWTALPVPDADAAPLAIDYQLIESAQANPVLADLDGDGVKEILHASYDGRVHAFWLDRTEHGNWPFDVNLGESELRFASEPVVADLDGDGDAEVVFTTWTEKGSNAGGDLFIVDALGNELQRVPLPRSASSWDGALAAPTVANLDADPLLELVVNTAHTGLVAYEIPGSSAIAAPRWPTGRGNVARTAPEPGAPLATAAALAAIAARSRRRTSGHASATSAAPAPALEPGSGT